MPNERPRIQVQLRDHTGNKTRGARLVADAPVQELVPALITALELPATDPTGRPVTYHLARADQRQLTADETLQSAGVQEGETMTLVPEMTAGTHS